MIDGMAQGDPVDPKSRHKGKYETESYLAEAGLPYTAIRPTYIYGPQVRTCERVAHVCFVSTLRRYVCATRIEVEASS